MDEARSSPVRPLLVVVTAFFLASCVISPSRTPPSGGSPAPDPGPPATRPECIACDDTAWRQAMCEASSASCSGGCSLNDPTGTSGCQATCMAEHAACTAQASISH